MSDGELSEARLRCLPRARTEAVVGSRLLPEMLFGSELSLTHEASGVALVFNATEALREWKVCVCVCVCAASAEPLLSARRQAEALAPVQVACAAAWASGHERRLREGSIRDWGASAASREDGAAAEDWTFTTPFGGSVRTGMQASGPGGIASGWRPVDERIDRTALLARDPILFYEELTLYESELDDNGSMSLTVKARAMPCAAPVRNSRASRCESCQPAGMSCYATGFE